MRSRPLPELLILCAVFMAAGFALHHLTAPQAGQPHARQTAGVPAETGNLLQAHAMIESAHPFSRLTIRVVSGDQPVLLTFEGGPTTEFSGNMNLPLVGGVPDMLSVEVEWPSGTPRSAMELIIEPDGHPSTRTTIWGEQYANSVLEVKL